MIWLTIYMTIGALISVLDEKEMIQRFEGLELIAVVLIFVLMWPIVLLVDIYYFITG